MSICHIFPLRIYFFCTYKKLDLGTVSSDDDLEATQELQQFKDQKVKLLKYFGLVPSEYLKNLKEEKEVIELFPEHSAADDYADLVEAIIVIGNENLLLKAEENPYMMKDRPILSYQDDTVPNRLLGRGTVEKAYNMQKATDAQIRSHLDSLALTTSPMIAMDATRLPRGAKFEVKPGKAILTNGAPQEILYPFKFGQTDQNNIQTAQINLPLMDAQSDGVLISLINRGIGILKLNLFFSRQSSHAIHIVMAVALDMAEPQQTDQGQVLLDRHTRLHGQIFT